jgi:hypothetical protein
MGKRMVCCNKKCNMIDCLDVVIIDQRQKIAVLFLRFKDSNCFIFFSIGGSLLYVADFRRWPKFS